MWHPSTDYTKQNTIVEVHFCEISILPEFTNKIHSFYQLRKQTCEKLKFSTFEKHKRKYFSSRNLCEKN